jgi:hypothetical protein
MDLQYLYGIAIILLQMPTTVSHLAYPAVGVVKTSEVQQLFALSKGPVAGLRRAEM